MFKNLTLTFFACFLISSGAIAQETWSLEKCVRYALEENINIQRAALGVQTNELNLKGNRMSRLPNLSASGSAGYQFGRTIDPVSNEFNSLSIGANSFGVNAGVTVYNGNRIRNSIKQSQYDVLAAREDLAQTKNDISLLIAQSYLNVLFAEEQLAAAIKRRVLSESQLEQVDKLIQAGARPKNDRLEILATIARNEQAIIGQENAVTTGLLNLKNLLQLDPGTDIKLEKPQNVIIDSSENPDVLALDELYKTSLSNQPFVRADENRYKSAELGKSIANSGRLPRLTAFGGLSTNFSTRAIRPDGTFEIINVSQPAFIDGNPPTPITLILPQTIPGLEDNPYFNQLNENFGQNIGLSLNVPIYSNHQNLINIERAELNMVNAQYTAEINKQNLKNDIQTAIANARTAKRTLQAAEITQQASSAAFENSEKQFQLGTINTFEYATSRNNLDQAEIDLIIAKYDYLFKLKVLDFYQGKTLGLK